ncbi:uncharacterized protein G2W53_039737 [Senna tora]|uniref:Uncharacterized protein n=1 Tax=Senna tora TaxID=362788 RepID=A0A834W6E6_9FABA|nr:uncharacterized protein G2W53_039737 [Senna tora]
MERRGRIAKMRLIMKQLTKKIL